MNELKSIFRKTDTVVNPYESREDRREVLEVETFYTGVNTILNTETFLSKVPVNNFDLQLKRTQLCAMFDSRVEFLVKQSIQILKANIHNLKLHLNRNIKCEGRYEIELGIFYQLDKQMMVDIRDKFGYIFDLLFYFDLDISKYSSLDTLALAIGSYMYSTVSIQSYNYNITDKEVEEIYLMVNSLIGEFSLSIKQDILRLIEESDLYFQAGNYVLDGNNYRLGTKDESIAYYNNNKQEVNAITFLNEF